ncbi:hypothetical protein [Fundicoccus culcitae]|uniref:Uncharacterized protein n=1 Tax=Fundicoccus culcitae TaxID=2969821 RepID=A0ABY5P4E0_9LACT|nr:hypothetical protein [Fundicoccus culcitae]UUX33607.1 hypothetical protein NRE15_11975 [Fundicoccus culcitae]
MKSTKLIIPTLLLILTFLLYLLNYINIEHAVFLAVASYYLWERENSKSELMTRYVVYLLLMLLMFLAKSGLIF